MSQEGEHGNEDKEPLDPDQEAPGVGEALQSWQRSEITLSEGN